MAAVIKLVLCIFWMVFLPVAAGGIPCLLLPESRRSFLRRAVSGYLVSFTVFEITALPVLLLTERGDFGLLCRIYMAEMLLLGILGAAAGRRRKPGEAAGRESFAGRVLYGCGISAGAQGKKAKLLWVIYLGLLAFKLVMALTHTFFDGDDAYYVASSVIADETGSMYRILPYVGGATSLDVRHAMAMLPMWIAFIARMSGTHATIVTHTMIPLAFHPLNDAVLALLGSELVRTAGRENESDSALPAFMIIAALWQVFGNVSIYTPENFLIMRVWQGKSMFVNFLIPLVFYIYLCLGRSYGRAEVSGLTEENSGRERSFLFAAALMASCTAGLFTSMAPVLTGGLMGLMSIYCAVTVRKRRIFLRTLIVVLPCIIYTALWFYLLFTVKPF